LGKSARRFFGGFQELAADRAPEASLAIEALDSRFVFLWLDLCCGVVQVWRGWPKEGVWPKGVAVLDSNQGVAKRRIRSSHIASNVEAKAKQGGHATRHDNRGKPVFSSSVSAVPLRCGAIGRIALAMAAPPRQPSGSQVAPEKSDAPCLINWLAVENYVQTNGSQCPYYGGWIVGQGQSESVQEEHAISRYVTPSKTKKQTAIPPDRHLPSATCHRPSAVSVLSIAFPTTPSIHFFPIAAPMTTPIHPFVPRSP
jgi:hypothetical protein